jgi:hypothetical protein
MSHLEMLRLCCSERNIPTPFVIARRSEQHVMKFIVFFEVNNRRSNLPSLIHSRELFNVYETTSLQSRARRLLRGYSKDKLD